MPFFKSDNALIYYAHVPKCGGSSISEYLRDRFGALAFQDNQFAAQSGESRWTRSSPQHIDRETLERLIPLTFFDAIFTIVRHPTARIVSTFHFQREVEGAIPKSLSFSDWLDQLDPTAPGFAYDNHILPMNRIVPEGAAVFHLEHGLDALIIWLDAITRSDDAGRAFEEVNKRGAHIKSAQADAPKINPSEADLKKIAALYAEDFERFGYRIDSAMPQTPAPQITPEFIAARDADLQRMNAPTARLKRKIKRRLSKSLNS